MAAGVVLEPPGTARTVMTDRTDDEKAELLKTLEALVLECEQEVADHADKKAKAGKDALEAQPVQNRFGAPVVAKSS